MTDWHIFQGTGEPHDDIERRLPPPPGWRSFKSEKRGETYQVSKEEIDLVNAALYLRRPLFITGKPGVGKSSLAYSVARELNLGQVLLWPITTRVTLKDGLYDYDAIGRLQDASLQRSSPKSSPPDIGQYLRLGPLGTALLPSKKPRVLLIDEIDKSDIDLPNDLLHIFEEGEFVIPELARITKQFEEVYVMPYDGEKDTDRVPIRGGKVHCDAFPFIIMTSNGEREFPPAFLRRCLRLDVKVPDEKRLTEIVQAHLGETVFPQAEQLVKDFVDRQKRGDLATDQLLNAIYLTTQANITLGDKETLGKALLRYLTSEAV
jgi:MoxR-like ATPase